MATQSLAKLADKMPSVFDDFFKPWNEGFDGEYGAGPKVPAVKIRNKKVNTCIPGCTRIKKRRLKIDVDGNMLTISSEKEENKEEKDERFTRKEYNYSSFSRSFNFLKRSTRRKLMQSTQMVY